MTPLLLASALFASTALPPVEDPRPITSMTWERVAIGTAAIADILTTRYAISKGAMEGNPLLTKLIGKQPSILKLVGVKAAAIALTELAAAHERKKGNYKRAKFLYVISAISWGYASGFNLRFAFK